VERLIRPTGLLDPVIEIRPSLNQIDDLIEKSKYVNAELRARFRLHTYQKNG
jgi:excinuclease ABC subunit B